MERKKNPREKKKKNLWKPLHGIVFSSLFFNFSITIAFSYTPFSLWVGVRCEYTATFLWAFTPSNWIHRSMILFLLQGGVGSGNYFCCSFSRYWGEATIFISFFLLAFSLSFCLVSLYDPFIYFPQFFFTQQKKNYQHIRNDICWASYDPHSRNLGSFMKFA